MEIPNKKKGLVLKVVNTLLNLLCLPGKLLSNKPDLRSLQPQKILLLRLDHIGDVVMTSPAFTALRARFPQAEIILLTDTAGAQLFNQDPRIDEVIVFNWPWVHQKKNNRFSPEKLAELYRLILQLRRRKIDMVIDFRGDLRFIVLFGVLTGIPVRISNARCGDSSLLNSCSPYNLSSHEVERSLAVLECFGGTLSNCKPEVTLTEQEIAAVRQLVALETGKPFPEKLAIIAPYSSKDIKSWPPACFREVIADLGSKGFTVLVAGTKDDREDARLMIDGIPGDIYSFAGLTSIRELAALVSVSGIVIGVDTGVLHIASCFEVPIIAIFGATRSVEFRPYSALARVLETHTCKCNQFLHDRCDYPVKGYALCLAELQPAAVIAAINELIPNQIPSE